MRLSVFKGKKPNFPLYSEKLGSIIFWNLTCHQPVFTSPAATPFIVSNTSVTKSSGGFEVSLNS